MSSLKIGSFFWMVKLHQVDMFTVCIMLKTPY